MKLDHLTVSPRKVLAAGGAVTVVVLVVLGAAGVGSPTAPRDPVPTATPAPGIPAGTAAPVGGPPDAGTEPAQDAAADTEPPAAVADDDVTLASEAAANQVATDFAAGYAEHHFDDGASATLDRVRAFVTDDLAAELARNSGAAAGRAEIAARQERAVATVQAVQRQSGSVGEGVIDLLVVVRQDVSWEGGSEIRWPSYLVRVTLVGDTWRVSRVLM